MTNTVELFTLRLWQEASSDKTEWRGKIQHIRSGQARYFRDWLTLVNFLLETVPEHDETSRVRAKSIGSRRATRRLAARANAKIK